MLKLSIARESRSGKEAALSALWRAMPWHVNALLALHDLAEPAARIQDQDAASVCVLLYSWNKAGPLEKTLASLRDSALGGARVVVLDNGSTDGTGTVIDNASGWFAHFDQITLPVNVGAPAARNWLLSLPQVRDHAYAAFLDDDIELPENWLAELLHAAKAHPEAGVVGCRVTDHTAPHRLQAADFNLLPPELAAPTFADLDEQAHMANNGLGLRDNGLFAYSRPCVSVTGCCHLVRMEAIRATGPFDVRFSPSQFDDLERDLRAFLQGFPAHYHGRVRIGHMQHSSLRQAATPARSAHIFGNRIKLEHLFEPGELAPVRERAAEMLWTDLNAKAAALFERYGDTP